HSITAEYAGTASAPGFSGSMSAPLAHNVEAKSVTVTPNSGQSKIFGAAEPALAYTMSETVAVTGALARAAGEDVGTYVINVGTLASSSTNYTLTLSATPVTFAVTAKTVTVTPNGGQSKILGSAEPALTYTLSKTVAVPGALASAPGQDVGTYVINVGT